MATVNTIKTAVEALFPIGTKIRRQKHVEANNYMIEALYYSDWGVPKPFLGSTLPENHVWCNIDGQVINASDCNPAFITAIGTLYGGNYNLNSNPTGTIGIPYIPAGYGLIQVGNTFTLGSKGGSDVKSLSEQEMPRHTHIQNAHNHTLPIRQTGSGSTERYPETGDNNPNDNTVTDNTTAINQYTGGEGTSQAPANGKEFSLRNPYFAVNYILRYR